MSVQTNFIDRLQASRIPLNRCIVIGSGALALHDIRDARDIDLVVTSDVYDMLLEWGWDKGKQGSSSVALERDDFEIWTDWSTDGSGHPDYKDLTAHTEIIEGIRCVTLDYLLSRKQERNSEKDKRDIGLILAYQQERKLR